MTDSQAKTCQSCKKEFVIEPEDFVFYEKLQVPPPTFCFHCRLRRRLTWRNERALYKGKCNMCGKSTFSIYPENVPFPVYCVSCWFSDRWDPMEYGKDYDFSKNFFLQFKELQDIVPRIALQVENVVNCEYTNQIMDCKNCYLITSGIGDEDCMFCYRANYSKNALDSFALMKCENVYEGFMGRESSNIFFSEGFADSLGLWFCLEPRGCQNCFMGANLRRASYVFRGKALSKEEYEQILSQIDTGSHAAIRELKKEFSELCLKSIHPHGTFKNVVDSTGNALANAKGSKYCFNGSDLENCKYCLLVDKAKDSMDVNNGGHIMELIYEMNTAGARAFNSKFCNDAWPEVRNLTYCNSCRSGAADLFGCISLRGKQYCILNKQYSKEEYLSLLPRIIEHMNSKSYRDALGRTYAYGEFFPSELSPFPYNDSMAQDFFPLTPESARTGGFVWNERSGKQIGIDLPAKDLPDHIRDADEGITAEIIGCEHEGRCNERCSVGFRLTLDELSFYRRYELPIPRLCPNCRHYERMHRQPPLELFERQCMCDYKAASNESSHGHHPSGRCPNTFQTSYAPDRPEIVYCDSCYNNEVS